MMQHSANGTALRLRFGTELSTGLSSSNIGSASEAVKPRAELPEPAVTKEDDTWSDTPVADTGERTAESCHHDMEHDPKASDELGPEPAGLESNFRFNLHDMKVDTLLGMLCQTYGSHFTPSLSHKPLTVSLKRVGRGSFATVHMGSISGKQAAIKCMRKTRLLIEKQGSFVQREREILRRLCTPSEQAHPLIINCFGTAQDSESVYFAFQPCLGGDFCSVLKNKRRGLPVPTVRYYMAEVLAALEYRLRFKLL